MGVYATKPLFQSCLSGAAQVLTRLRVHPDVLTLSALAVSLLGGLAFAQSGHLPGFLLLAPVITFTRTALNALDGMVAFSSGIARPWGEVLNEFCDRLSDVVLLGGFAFSGLVSVHLVWLTVIASLLTDDLGVLSKAAGAERQYGGIMGKADRMILLAAVPPFALAHASDWVISAMFAVMLIGCLVTIIQRGRQAHAHL